MTIRNINEVIVTKTSKYSPITPADLLNTYNDGCGYVGFIGGVELNNNEENDLVPEGFINSTKTVDEVQAQKTWKEYCLNSVSSVTGKYLLTFMHVWRNGCRYKIKEADEALEWRKWYEVFGARLMTKSDFRTKRTSEEYNPTIE
jgi:hypothetical protein